MKRPSLDSILLDVVGARAMALQLSDEHRAAMEKA